MINSISVYGGNMISPVISVIVPCYNVENYIEKCIKSILNQSYSNLEIICVNDGSTDATADKLDFLKSVDARISIITHEQNSGLFRARVTGLQHAHGDYVAFIDSDDYIDDDFFRCLIDKAMSGNYDIVMGDTVHEDENGYRWVHSPYSDIIVKDRYGADVLGELLAQEGYCFIWHSVWNKIYKRGVIDKAIPFLIGIKEHIIMGEDVLFSCILHYYAQSFAKAEYAYYFYLQRKGASTALDNRADKFKKSIGDLGRVFYYVNSFFDSHGVNSIFKKHFDAWRELYSRYWHDNVFNSALPMAVKQSLYIKIKNDFKVEKLKNTTDADNWFYSISIPFDNRYIGLKDKIKKYDIISIDIFDTLVIRKVYRPSDVFLFMDEWFHNISGRDFDFSHARVHAEKTARKESKYEEVNLDEIYAVFCKENGVSEQLAAIVEKKEVETEKNLCTLRKSVVNIIKYSHSIGKTVVLTSDFYFNKEQLTDLLNAINANNYDDIVLSSEYRATKATGTLFEVLNDKFDGSTILHIGNSWDSDYIKAKQNGVDAHFYAATVEAFMYNISDINSTDSTRLYKRPTGLWDNFEHSLDFFEVRCLLANVSNKIFDNPYTSYIKGTDFNAQARFFGYYALGMHLWGIARWLYEPLIAKKEKIHFVARDGFLPMLAYNRFNNDESAAQAGYFYSSRKASFPLCWRNKDDIDCVVSQIKKATPKQLLEWFSPLLNKKEKDSIKKFMISKWANSQIEGEDLYEFIANDLKLCYSASKQTEFFYAMKKYYGEIINKGDAIFDVGYSGRILLNISQLLGFPVDGYFIHRINDQFIARQKALGIKVNTYYDYTPSITGVIREILFSKQAPSCIGFNIIDGATPVFEQEDITYSSRFAIEEVQRYALALVEDVVPIYKMAPKLFSARSSDVSAPFEYMLHCSSSQDREYFNCVKFEDDVYFGKSNMRVTDVWQNDINYHHVMHYPEVHENVVHGTNLNSDGRASTLNYEATRSWSKVKKAFYYFLFDNKVFWEKLKNRLKKRK